MIVRITIERYRYSEREGHLDWNFRASARSLERGEEIVRYGKNEAALIAEITQVLRQQQSRKPEYPRVVEVEI